MIEAERDEPPRSVGPSLHQADLFQDREVVGEGLLRDVVLEATARELGKRKIAFIAAREGLESPRLGPALKQAFGGVFIANQGFTKETAERAILEGEADAVAFGKLFISNPDLPERFRTGAPLTPWDDRTFYSDGPAGYTDYPRHGERASASRVEEAAL